MSFSSTVVAGGGGAVIEVSPPQEASPATAVRVITRLRSRIGRIDIDVVMRGSRFTKSVLLWAPHHSSGFPRGCRTKRSFCVGFADERAWGVRTEGLGPKALRAAV